MKTPLRILTIDLEDWYHILDHPETRLPVQWEKFPSRLEANTDRLLELLERHNLKATWFCLGWVADRFPHVIRRIAARHEIAAHTYHHELAYQQDCSTFVQDAVRVRQSLEDITGRRVSVFRAAGFSVTNRTPWFAESLLEAGYESDSSIFPASRNHGGFPLFPSHTPCILRTASGDLMEFPISTHSWMCFRQLPLGGGYFRLIPTKVLERWAKRDDYLLTYFHPRDFDSHQPVLASLPLHRRFMSYYGLSGAYAKLDRLLEVADYSSIELAMDRIDRKSLPVFEWPGVNAV